MATPRSAVGFGRIHGNVVELETAIPELEGQRVRVELREDTGASVLAELLTRAADPSAVLSSDEQARLWRAWKTDGPDGPLSEEDAGLP